MFLIGAKQFSFGVLCAGLFALDALASAEPLAKPDADIAAVSSQDIWQWDEARIARALKQAERERDETVADLQRRQNALTEAKEKLRAEREEYRDLDRQGAELLRRYREEEQDETLRVRFRALMTEIETQLSREPELKAEIEAVEALTRRRQALDQVRMSLMYGARIARHKRDLDGKNGKGDQRQ